MEQKHVFRIIPRLFSNISKSVNIQGGDFYRTWTVKVILLELAHAHFMSFNTVPTLLEEEEESPSTITILIPNIPRFANNIPNTLGMTRKMSFTCIIVYCVTMQQAYLLSSEANVDMDAWTPRTVNISLGRQKFAAE